MPFRWLCLHGGEMNSTMFKIQLSPIIKILQIEHDCEFIFINATHPAEHSRLPQVDCYPGEKFMWLPFADESNKETMEQCHQYIRHKVDECGPIDGIIAYSQSSMLVCDILVRQMLEKVDILGPLRCCVIISGYPPHLLWGPDAGGKDATTRISADSLPGRFAVPSLHVAGTDDYLRGFSLAFKELFDQDSARLLEFEGDHWIPSNPTWVTQMTQAMKSLMAF